MIVTQEDFKNGILELFMTPGYFGCDTETTGLRWWEDDHLISLILSSEKESLYFNFNNKPDHLGNLPEDKYILPKKLLPQFQSVFSVADSTWYIHNAKFDLGMLAKDGLQIGGRIHCTEAVARLLDSEHYNYTLDACVKRKNKHLRLPEAEKSDAVKAYCKKHKLFEKITIPGKKKSFESYFYHQVPFDVIAPYGVTDGRTVWDLGDYQRTQINTRLYNIDAQCVHRVIDERRLTPVLFEMEKTGLKIDLDYTKAALEKEKTGVAKLKATYKAYTGMDFVDSGVQFKKYFDNEGVDIQYTEKGNPKFDKNALAEMDHPLSAVILEIRACLKRISSYYTNFLYYVSKTDGAVHPSIKQSGTQTGRMSIREPALQTIPKLTKDPDDQDEEDDIDAALVRKCFIPPKDHCLFLPDYDQMEYRMMVDEAEEMELIEAILGGLDVHSATAELVGCERKQAKTINFLLLYGGGTQKLADALGITYTDAANLKALYFSRLPMVKRWVRKTIAQAEFHGYTKNWAGRICKLDKNFAYKAPNYYIQGGCADLVKKAMLDINRHIQGKVSKMTLQIHDELMFNLHKDELDLAPQIVEIMETTYPYKHLKLTAGPGYSWTHWGEKQDGYPTRDQFQKQSKESVGSTSGVLVC